VSGLVAQDNSLFHEDADGSYAGPLFSIPDQEARLDLEDFQRAILMLSRRQSDDLGTGESAPPSGRSWMDRPRRHARTLSRPVAIADAVFAVPPHAQQDKFNRTPLALEQSQ
jgi:hypothetical protein